MLQVIRDRATGWFAWVIVILLVIPFALWGIQEYFGGGAEKNLAQVKDVPISKYDFYSRLDREKSRLEEPLNEAQEKAFKESVLNKMIQEELLAQLAAEQGYRISDALLVSTIHAMSGFQRDGKFDEEYFRNVLRNNGLTVAGFEYLQKREMLIRQFLSGMAGSAFVTPYEIEQLLRLQNQQRKFSYALLPAKQFADAIAVSEEQIAAHYEQYRDRYMTPEQIKLEYLVLDVRDMEQNIAVSEGQLRAMYDEYKSGLATTEQRHAAHILVEVQADANSEDEEKAKAKAEELYARIKAGDDFAALAKEFSEDASSSEQGGDLGVIERGTLDASFEDALYNLKQDEVSEPVRSAFGYHLIKLVAITGADKKSFEEMREELEVQYRKQEAEPLFYDRLEAFTDLTYENPQTLEVAANELGLQVRESDWITRAGASEGVLASEKVTAAAFSEMVFAGGDPAQSANSQPLELVPEDTTRIAPVVVIRLKQHQPSMQRDLGEVRGVIRTELEQSALRKKIQEEGSALLAKLREGSDFAQLASEHDLKLVESGYESRSGGEHDPAVVGAAFKLKRPKAGAPEYTGFTLPSGDYVLIGLVDVKAGEVDKDQEQVRQFMVRFLQNTYGNREVESMLQNLRKSSDVTVFQDRLSQDDET